MILDRGVVETKNFLETKLAISFPGEYRESNSPKQSAVRGLWSGHPTGFSHRLMLLLFLRSLLRSPHIVLVFQILSFENVKATLTARYRIRRQSVVAVTRSREWVVLLLPLLIIYSSTVLPPLRS